MGEPNREARRRRIMERVKQGETRKQIIENEKISRVTLWSDLKALDTLFLAENSDEIKELKRRVAQSLIESANNVLTGELRPEQANAWRAIMSDFSKLLGLNAPTVVGHVTADAADLPRYRVILNAFTGLSEEQENEVLEIARKMPRYYDNPLLPETTDENL